MIGTNHKHLYRHFNGGRLIEGHPKGMRDMEYLGYIATVEYDGQTYRTFVPNRSFPSDRLQPTFLELATYGV